MLCTGEAYLPSCTHKSSSLFCSALAFAASIGMCKDYPPWRFSNLVCINFAMASDTTDQTNWTTNIKREDWTLLELDLYCKINLTLKLSSLSRSSVALSVWAATRIYLNVGVGGSVASPSHMDSYLCVQGPNQPWMRPINSLCLQNHLLSSSPSLALSGVCGTSWLRFAGLFIDSRDASWAVKCYQSHQSYSLLLKQRGNPPGMQHRCKKTLL